MKNLLLIAAAALSLVLTGCASTVRSDVTTFHQWPADLQDKSFVIEAPLPQDDTLELRSYQGLVRAELAKLGFTEALSGTPALKVALRFTTTDIPVRTIEPVYPAFYPRAQFMFGPIHHRGWGGRRYWGASPFYDPFWYGMPQVTEEIHHVYRRELQVSIKLAGDGKRLYDVTVHNNSEEVSTPVMMPALVQSAFIGFPGVSGVARRVTLKRES
ncbi:MAG: DUF4136 domain-containing protein [Pseudomonadota bacterium]